MPQSSKWCPTCNKSGRLPDQCWITHPHLKKAKKVQAVEGEEELNFIDLGALEVPCIGCNGHDVNDYGYNYPPGLSTQVEQMPRSMGGTTSPEYSGHNAATAKADMVDVDDWALRRVSSAGNPRPGK